MRNQLMRFPSSVRRNPAIEAGMREHAGPLEAIAQRWFEVMHNCGDDGRERLHDGHPTACGAAAADMRQRIELDFDFGSSGIERLLHLSRDAGEVEIIELEALGGTSYRLALMLGGGTGDWFKFDIGEPFVAAAIPESSSLALCGLSLVAFISTVPIRARHSSSHPLVGSGIFGSERLEAVEQYRRTCSFVSLEV